MKLKYKLKTLLLFFIFTTFKSNELNALDLSKIDIVNVKKKVYTGFATAGFLFVFYKIAKIYLDSKEDSKKSKTILTFLKNFIIILSYAIEPFLDKIYPEDKTLITNEIRFLQSLHIIFNKCANVLILLSFVDIIRNRKTNITHKYKPIVFDEKDAKLGLDAIAGNDDVKKELNKIFDFLRKPKLYKEIGAVMPKGILFEGPSGNGKTSIVRAFAQMSKIPFFYEKTGTMQDKWVGTGANKIKELFDAAKKNAPSAVFLDELDALGIKSDYDGNYGRQALNTLLDELDGFIQNELPIIIFGATNRIEDLDPALLRPGRFDQIIKVSNPNLKDRKKILKLYIDKIKTKKVEDLRNDVKEKEKKESQVLQNEVAYVDQKFIDHLANLTEGYSGAALKTLVNEAAINAVFGKRDLVTKKDFEIALESLSKTKDKSIEATMIYL